MQVPIRFFFFREALLMGTQVQAVNLLSRVISLSV